MRRRRRRDLRATYHYHIRRCRPSQRHRRPRHKVCPRDGHCRSTRRRTTARAHTRHRGRSHVRESVRQTPTLRVRVGHHYIHRPRRMRRRRRRDLRATYHYHIRRCRPSQRHRRPRHKVCPRDGHCRSTRRRTTARAHTRHRGRSHVRESVRQTPTLRVRVGHHYIHRPRRMRRRRRRDLRATYHYHIRRCRPSQRHRRPRHKVCPRDGHCRSTRRRTTARAHTRHRGRSHVRESVRQTPTLRVRVGHHYIHRPRRMRRRRRRDLRATYHYHIRRCRPSQRHRRPRHKVCPRDGHCRSTRRRTTARAHTRHRGRSHVRESVRQTPTLRVRVGHHYIHRPRRMRRRRRRDLRATYHYHIRRCRPSQRHRRPRHKVCPRDGHCRSTRRRTTARAHTRHRGRSHVRESVRQTPTLRVRVGHHYIHRPRRMRRRRRRDLRATYHYHIRRCRPSQRHRRPRHKVCPRDGHCRSTRRRTTARAHTRHRGRSHVRESVRQTPTLRVRVGHHYIHRPRRMRRRRRRDLRATYHYHIRRCRPSQRHRRPRHEVCPRDGHCRSTRRRTTARAHTGDRGRGRGGECERQSQTRGVRVGDR